MGIVFDNKGNAINSIPDERNNDKKGTVVICPNCKSVTVYPEGMISTKTKPRICGRCRTYLGEW